jgi:omega-6 fatty acid desaturase (delta-12 desaturase)
MHGVPGAPIASLDTLKERGLDRNTGAAGQAALEWRHTLPERLKERSDLIGGTYFLIWAGLWALTFVGAFLAPSPALRMSCGVLQSISLGALFVVGHDACHGSLMRSAWLNRLISRLALLPAWHPSSGWKHAHNTLHHGGTNLRGRDCVYPPLTLDEYRRLPFWRRALERVYRTPLGIGLYYLIDFHLGQVIFPRPGRMPPNRRIFEFDRGLTVGFFAAQLGFAWWLSGLTPDPIGPRWLVWLGGGVAPWVCWIWTIAFVSWVQHTHPAIAWYDDPERWNFHRVQLTASVHMTFPPVLEQLFNNIMDHPAHHLDSKIPLYRLKESQRLLESTAPEHSVVIPWSLTSFLEGCRVCKLYDFERRLWTDFEGRPTSAPHVDPLEELDFLQRPWNGNLTAAEDRTTRAPANALS